MMMLMIFITTISSFAASPERVKENVAGSGSFVPFLSGNSDPMFARWLFSALEGFNSILEGR